MNLLGSTWHLWDLHIHTDASDGKSTCHEILEAAKKKNISCIAVTDHHSVANIDKMKTLAESFGISVISGVEFRTEYGKSSVHMIGLFPDEYQGMLLDSEFLTENVLNQLKISRTMMIQKGREYSKLQNLTDDEYLKIGMFQVQVDFKEASKIIHKYGGIVTVHAGSKSNSIDVEMKHEGKSAKNVSIEDSLGPVKEELFKEDYIDICDLTKPRESSFYLKTFGKPSITTSDAHNAEEVGTNACWIKADLTFDGLKHIIAEPERVSFAEPNILRRIRLNPDKFINYVEIRRTTAASMPETWFDNIRIPLNPGLVAIIGNKGCGKSALTDIIALCADTTNQNWAFLTSSKFRMTKPYNRSKQIEASILWRDNSHSAIKTLDLSSDTTQPERVKYIPQNFLESLCTTEDDNEFESELKKIIFQYLDPSQRYGMNDLDSIINYLTKENTALCSAIQSRIKDLNSNIINLEEKLVPDYKQKLSNELKYKQEQLSNVQSAKPKEVNRPSTDDNAETKKAKEEIDKIQELNRQLSTSIEKQENERIAVVKAIQDLKAGKECLERHYNQIVMEKNELSTLFSINDIDINQVLPVSFHPELISSQIDILNGRLNLIDQELDSNNPESLISRQAIASQQLENAKKKLSAPDLEYQKYLKDKEEWENKLDEITGSVEKDGTIKNLQARIDYLNHQLVHDLDLKKKERASFVNELILKKKEVLDTYNHLFAPIVEFIGDYHEELKDYPIEFDSTFAIRGFEDKFFDHVSQQFAGSYYGKEQGLQRLKDSIDDVDFSDLQSIVKFTENINSDLLNDKRDEQNTPKIVEAQLKKGHTKQELYDYIYGLDYIVPFFQLKMNDKSLSSLSPGERGALLLLLYLFIDMDDKPLIIDQPEENLDNESVYKYLVHFIKAAKEKRQIIMVTHNPNLAVVCDADQVIQMKIDKQNGNTVSFESGAIENPKMNKIIVDILEGTYPAFHNRDCKYFDKAF